MSVTLLVSELTDAELRLIGAKHENKEKLEEIARELDNDMFRAGLIEQKELSLKLFDYILKTKNENIFEKLAKRPYNTRIVEKKLLDLQSEKVDRYLMMNPKLDKETLKDLSEKYSEDRVWYDRLFFHDSAGDYFFEKELNRIKELEFKKIINSKDLQERILRIAEKTKNKEILEQLARIRLWDIYVKYSEQLKSDSEQLKSDSEKLKSYIEYYQKEAENFFNQVHLQVAKNHNCHEKTLYFMIRNEINVQQLDEEFINSIFHNPNVGGFTIAYTVALFNNVNTLPCSRYIKKHAKDIIDIVKKHFENM